MSTDDESTWVDLLKTAKTIRRSVRPVSPSTGFRSHLRSDLESAFYPRQPMPRVITRRSPLLAPSLLIAVCLGLSATALTLILLRDRRPGHRSPHD